MTTRIFKVVTFYLARALRETAPPDWEVAEVRWFALAEAITQLSYKGERAILQKAAKMLEDESSSPT